MWSRLFQILRQGPHLIVMTSDKYSISSLKLFIFFFQLFLSISVLLFVFHFATEMNTVKCTFPHVSWKVKSENYFLNKCENQYLLFRTRMNNLYPLVEQNKLFPTLVESILFALDCLAKRRVEDQLQSRAENIVCNFLHSYACKNIWKSAFKWKIIFYLHQTKLRLLINKT